MLKKVYDKSLTFIKKNYKLLIVYIFLLCLFTIPLDYEVYTPGGLINLTDRIEVDTKHEETGSFNLTYVGAKKGIIPMILLSYIIPNWDLVSIDEVRIDEEDYDEIQKRGKIDLTSVNQNAIAVAFDLAHLPYKITSYDIAVYHVFNESKTDLKVGDIVKTINNKSVKTLEELKSEILLYEVGQKVYFTVEREGKEVNCYGIIYEKENEKIIGLYLQTIISVETNPKVIFNYNNNEQGSSGGLMSALEIYNSITSQDLTKGDIISGTGTINLDGTVGEIAGVKYKLAGAVKKKAKVFIVPVGNYEEAISEKEKNNYNIEVIKADTFENVVNKLISR